VGVQDSTSDLIELFKQEVAKTVFETAQGWHVANRDFFLFPRNCRFLFTKGRTTIAVIEQDPQIRTLLCAERILGPQTQLYVPPGPQPPQDSQRVSLAMPYSIFIFHFNDAKFSNLYYCWRKAPLRSLEDKISNSLLPNIHDNMAVCLGNENQYQFGTIADQIDRILGDFWNSRFNNDLSIAWWRKQNIDSRLETAHTWSEHSMEDSTFILQVDFSSHTDRTLKEKIELLTVHEEAADENGFRHRLAENIDNSAGMLFTKILRYFKKTKFDKYHPKEIKEAVVKIMKEANGEFLDLIFAVEHELEVLKGQIQEESRKGAICKAGDLWTDYSP
jgi:hypothetical protein